jgi:DNA repair protein RadD
MTLELRPYQRASINGIYDYFSTKDGNPLVVIPTGGGKSLIIAQFIIEALQQYPETRILCLTHVKELIAQNHAELMGLWPTAPAGIYSAGLRKKEIASQVLFAGVQSIWNKAYNLQLVDLVLIDEAHLIPRSSNTTYRKLIADLLVINPHLKVIGFTATPFRLDSGLLHDGDDAVFNDIAYEVNIRDLMEQGYLTPLASQAGHNAINTAGVATRGGEFVAGQLDMAASDPETVELIASEIVAAGQDRKGWIAFGCGVKHCTMLRDAIRVRGYSCESIFGDTPAAERDAIIEAFKRQEIRCLSSMGVLTTGFNARHVDLVAVARPTKSTGLWIQIAGRGTRLFPGKENCLVLDFGSNIERHGPIDKPKIKQPNKGDGGEIPTKTCPNCEATCLISARECPDCGHEFDFEGAKVSTQASKLSILSAPPPPPEWLNVSSVSYSLHAKPGKPTSMKARYRCGMVWHTAWHCFNHSGYARTMAEKYWREAGGQLPVPATTEEALERTGELLTPSRILVKAGEKFPEIKQYDFTEARNDDTTEAHSHAYTDRPSSAWSEEYLPEDFAA